MRKLPLFLAVLLAAFGVTAANAAEIDFTPLVNAAITWVAVPLAVSLAAIVSTYISKVMAERKLISAQTAEVFQTNVDNVLNKAISFGATQASAYVGDHNLRANVDGWVASYAAKYAVDHAPDLMKQAGDVSQKIVARLAEHPAVQELKAEVAAAPLDLHPAI